MRYVLLMMFALLISNPVYSATVVTGVVGAIIDGGSITITGSDFGENAPNVVLFDDFESGTANADISTGTGSAKFGEWNLRSGSSYYGIANSLSGENSFTSSYASGYLNFLEASLPPDTRNLFISWWLYIPAGTNYPGEGTQDGDNWKQMWVQGSSTTDDDLVVPTRLGSWVINGNDQDPGYVNYTTVNMSKGSWKRLWIWLKGSTNSASADGEVKFWELTDSGVIQRENDTSANNLKATGSWEKVRLNGYGRTTPNCITSFDDIYIATGANAQARVELGNAPTYAASTKLTILTPTSWSAGSISATVNIGMLDGDTDGYLYVTDAEGTTSAGFPVIKEQSSQDAVFSTGSSVLFN